MLMSQGFFFYTLNIWAFKRHRENSRVIFTSIVVEEIKLYNLAISKDKPLSGSTLQSTSSVLQSMLECLLSKFAIPHNYDEKLTTYPQLKLH